VRLKELGLRSLVVLCWGTSGELCEAITHALDKGLEVDVTGSLNADGSIEVSARALRSDVVVAQWEWTIQQGADPEVLRVAIEIAYESLCREVREEVMRDEMPRGGWN
jgi:hypothetical protein